MPPRDRRGFDPNRHAGSNRPEDLVTRILSRNNAPVAGRESGFTHIRVIGVGGAGTNAVNRMIDAGLSGVDFVAVNTDAQALESSLAPESVLIGPRTTQRLGAGGDPRRGERAAAESGEELADATNGADMVFIAAGMGGGTGTGAAPTIAEIASAQGALTVGVVTYPFLFEGSRRRRIAEAGVQALRDRVDALIVVHNDRLLDASNPRMGIADAFVLADEMLHRGVQGVADLITTTGMVNVDFADVRAVMTRAGNALMGVGEATGEDRAIAAVEEAMRSPLLEMGIDDARGVLLNVAGASDITLAELNTAAQAVAGVVAEDANIIFGSVIDQSLGDRLRITLIATGFRGSAGSKSNEGARRAPGGTAVAPDSGDSSDTDHATSPTSTAKSPAPISDGSDTSDL